MKKSVIFAFFIFLATIGWLLSGQIGSVNAEDDNKKIFESSEDTNDENVINQSENILKVETQIFISEQIDQSITLQGQTTHNRTIDVKSETTGNITNINFIRGDFVKSKQDLITISIEDRQELYNSSQKDLERLKKEIIINKKNRDNLLIASNLTKCFISDFILNTDC